MSDVKSTHERAFVVLRRIVSSAIWNVASRMLEAHGWRNERILSIRLLPLCAAIVSEILKCFSNGERKQQRNVRALYCWFHQKHFRCLLLNQLQQQQQQQHVCAVCETHSQGKNFHSPDESSVSVIKIQIPVMCPQNVKNEAAPHPEKPSRRIQFGTERRRKEKCRNVIIMFHYALECRPMIPTKIFRRRDGLATRNDDDDVHLAKPRLEIFHFENSRYTIIKLKNLRNKKPTC